MALTNLAVFGGAFFTPIVVGKITHTIRWPWTFYLITIFTAVCLPLVIFFVPETAYRRSSHLNTDMASTENIQDTKTAEPSRDANLGGGEGLVDAPTTDSQDATEKPAQPPRLASPVYGSADTPMKSYRQHLMPFSGRITDDSFFKLFLRPFPLFAHPAVLWACLIQGTMIGWTVFIGIILAAVFIGPPLFWDEVNTGYAYTGAFIGALLGFVIAGVLSDWSAKYMTRKNNGLYEPEFRIILVIPQLVFGCAGLYLFGVTASRLADYSWVLPIFAFGLEVGGMVIGAVAASLYIIDAHRMFALKTHRNHRANLVTGDIAIEAFTCILIFKVRHFPLSSHHTGS
jgi:MFS family permease